MTQTELPALPDPDVLPFKAEDIASVLASIKRVLKERDAIWKQHLDAALMAREAVEVPPGWASVDDELPPPNPINDANSVRVLFYVPGNREDYSVQLGALWFGKYWSGDRGYELGEVTHWKFVASPTKGQL